MARQEASRASAALPGPGAMRSSAVDQRNVNVHATAPPLTSSEFFSLHGFQSGGMGAFKPAWCNVEHVCWPSCRTACAPGCSALGRRFDCVSRTFTGNVQQVLILWQLHAQPLRVLLYFSL